MSNPYDPAWGDTAARHQPPPVPPVEDAPAEAAAPVSTAPVSDAPAPWAAPVPWAAPPPYQTAPAPAPPPYPAPPPPYQTPPPPYQTPPYQAPWAPPATPYQGSPPPPGMVQPPAASPPPAYPYQKPPPYQVYPPAPPGYPPFGQGYGPYPQPPVPKKKSRVGLIIGIVAAVVVLCLGVGAFLVVRVFNNLEGPTTHLEVDLSGQGPIQLTLIVDSSTVEDGTRTLPYSYIQDVRGTLVDVTVRAQAMQPGGSVSCRILANGTVKAQQTVTGFGSPAVCIAFV